MFALARRHKRDARPGCVSAKFWQGIGMRIPVVSIESKPLMPTISSRCRKMLRDGVAEKRWTKEGVFYIRMLIYVREETQEMALAIDPGSKFDGYCVSGSEEIVLMGMSVLPSRVKKRMETRKMLRRSRRGRKCRRRKARFNNRKHKDGWIAPSQLAKVQLRTRVMERLCRIFPITDIIIEDVKFNHYKHRYGKWFSTVEIGKTKVYAAAEELATLWLPRGWDTAQARKDYSIEKCEQKSKLSPKSHANDALAMCCWLYGWKPRNNTNEFYVWRRQGYSRRQLHLQNPATGGKRRNYGGTVNVSSLLRKGDVIRCHCEIVGYVGGWTRKGKTISLTGVRGKRLLKVGISKIELLARSPNILTERRTAHFSP